MGEKRTAAIMDEIARRISEGEPLRAICREPHMPSWRAVYDWIEQDADFAARIAHARALGADAIAEEALEIIDNLTEDPASRRVRLEGRLKLLAKWQPKKYGDKVAVGGDADNPLTVAVQRIERVVVRGDAKD